ncbi:MAG: hypothetical protein ACJ763_05095 [Bdellovibrionia bacterium]
MLSRFQTLWLFLVSSVFIVFVACTGPKPSAGPATILPPLSAGAPYRVSLVVKNDGSGEGQIDLNVRLHEKRQQAAYSADQKVNLKGHESVHVIVSVPAPPGDYTAEVSAEYPPG